MPRTPRNLKHPYISVTFRGVRGLQDQSTVANGDKSGGAKDANVFGVRDVEVGRGGEGRCWRKGYIYGCGRGSGEGEGAEGGVGAGYERGVRVWYWEHCRGGLVGRFGCLGCCWNCLGKGEDGGCGFRVGSLAQNVQVGQR